MPFDRKSHSGGGGFIGVGYSQNLNKFTGTLGELSNRTGGVLIRGSFGDNNIGFSMFNDVGDVPHWGGGTDQGLTGTGDLAFTRGLGQNESFTSGVFFKDITGIPDKSVETIKTGPRYTEKNKAGVYQTKGVNKNLNFGMLGMKSSYTRSALSTNISIFRYGGAQGAFFQDWIHTDVVDPQVPLFPYDMNDSKTGVEIGF